MIQSKKFLPENLNRLKSQENLTPTNNINKNAQFDYVKMNLIKIRNITVHNIYFSIAEKLQ